MNAMNIDIEVVSGTPHNTRANLKINENMTGELTMERGDFTKFCDLLFREGYTITGKVAKINQP